MSQSQDTPQTVSDRRTAARVGFGAKVSICEYSRHAGMPKSGEFRAVTASDLSQTGISFITTGWPKSDSLVVMFGEEKPSQVVARVVNIHSESNDPADRRFDVSCEFVEWLTA